MWARILEFLLAVWLCCSPYIFHYPKEASFIWINDWACALLVGTFALLSFKRSLGKMHLLTFLVALWLFASSYQGFPEIAQPAQENSAMVGLLLLMLAIIPSQSSKLNRSWEEFTKK